MRKVRSSLSLADQEWIQAEYAKRWAGRGERNREFFRSEIDKSVFHQRAFEDWPPSEQKWFYAQYPPAVIGPSGERALPVWSGVGPDWARVQAADAKQYEAHVDRYARLVRQEFRSIVAAVEEEMDGHTL